MEGEGIPWGVVTGTQQNPKKVGRGGFIATKDGAVFTIIYVPNAGTGWCSPTGVRLPQHSVKFGLD